MKLISVIDYDICNYKLPSMFLIFPYCTFKCGYEECQNYRLSKEPYLIVDTQEIVDKYLKNPLTHAVVCGGLEPFDSKEDLFLFIQKFRKYSKDPIVIYTGYTESEITTNEKDILKFFGNIIVKYGRYIPNAPERFDDVLGVTLASDNQYAVYYE